MVHLEMSRPSFARERRRGLRLIWEWGAGSRTPTRYGGAALASETDLRWFVEDTPRAARDGHDVRGELLDFETWADAEAWMQGGA